MSREAELAEVREAKEKRNQTIVTMKEQGCTQQQIADMVGCGKSTVIRVLNAYKENKSDNVVNAPAPKSNKPVKVVPSSLTDDSRVYASLFLPEHRHIHVSFLLHVHNVLSYWYLLLFHQEI